MTQLWNSPLGPFVWLAGSAIVLLVLGKYRRELRLSNAMPATVTGIALLLWLILRFQADQPELLWSWRTELGWEATLRIHLDGWSWLAGLGVLLISFVAVALPGWRWQPGFVDPRIWVLLSASAGLLVLLSGTWLTLLACWVLLMLAAGLIADETAGLVWAMGALTVLLLLLAFLVNGSDNFGSVLESLSLNIQAQFLVVLAGVIALAVYPFHLWLDADSPRAPGRQLAIQLAPGIPAFYLLGRFDLPLLSSQVWVTLVVIALFGSALAAWAFQDERRSSTFLLINRCTWAVLALGLARSPAPTGGIFPLALLMLGAALWTTAGVAQWHYNWRWPAILGILVLFGFPLTPGFLPNLLLGTLASTSIGFAAWLLVLLAQSLIFTALLLRRYPQPEEPGTPTAFAPISLALTLALSAGLAIYWGVFPAALVNLAGTTENLTTDIRAAMSGFGLSSWLMILLPILFGALLALADVRLFANLRDWQETVAQTAGLRWLYAIVGRGLALLAYPMGFVADLIDGAGQFGWVLFVVLVALILFA
ncbi:MAG: hypothetical protein J5I90_18110 [Caldilineales bacterium]|nr:hypothetical protein [Caldilineales bacterium]